MLNGRTRFGFAALAGRGVMLACAGSMLMASVASAQLSDAHADSSDAVRTFDEHVRTLANPFFEGRVPGSRGIERAAEYLSYHLQSYGLEPAFDGSTYQWFEFGTQLHTKHESLRAMTAGNPMHFSGGVDFRATGLGSSGVVSNAALSFVGYGVERGPGGYSSFGDTDDLSGKVAMLMRFEPMDESGTSLWADGPRWTNATWFNNKLEAMMKRNPAAIIVVNTPGANDPRNASLIPGGSGRSALDVPVFMMSTDAADRLIRAADPEGRSLLQWRRQADAAGGVTHFDGVQLTLEASLEYGPNRTANVGAILRGQGDLADELIVVGAHYDHLGMGTFGSRSGAGQLHTGADDNASGTSGMLLLAEKMAIWADTQPEDVDRRSVLFMGFSAEESGLNGSKYYVEHPVVPLEQHELMINFDMIGRVDEAGVTLFGTRTAEGMSDWLTSFVQRAPFEVGMPNQISGRSDHASFYQKGIPVLFAMNATLHEDYHTPDDVSWKINREGAVGVVELFESMMPALMKRQRDWVFAGKVESIRDDSGGPQMGRMRIRFGISPGSYEDTEMGVLVGDVYEKTSAGNAGVKPGDRLVAWDGEPINDVRHWMELMMQHEPEDVVRVGIVRDGFDIEIDIVLLAREQDG